MKNCPNKGIIKKNFIIYLILFLTITLYSYSCSNSGKEESVKNESNFPELTASNIEQFTNKGIVIVDFWATWCGPCKIQTRILDDLTKEIQNKALIAKVDVDKNRQLAIDYNIEGIPTIIIFKDGKIKKYLVGVQSKEVLINEINSLTNLK